MNDLIADVIDITVYIIIAIMCMTVLIGLHGKADRLAMTVNEYTKNGDVLGTNNGSGYFAEDEIDYITGSQAAAQVWSCEENIDIYVDNTILVGDRKAYAVVSVQFPYDFYTKTYVTGTDGKLKEIRFTHIVPY